MDYEDGVGNIPSSGQAMSGSMTNGGGSASLGRVVKRKNKAISTGNVDAPALRQGIRYDPDGPLFREPENMDQHEENVGFNRNDGDAQSRSTKLESIRSIDSALLSGNSRHDEALETIARSSQAIETATETREVSVELHPTESGKNEEAVQSRSTTANPSPSSHTHSQRSSTVEGSNSTGPLPIETAEDQPSSPIEGNAEPHAPLPAPRHATSPSSSVLPRESAPPQEQPVPKQSETETETALSFNVGLEMMELLILYRAVLMATYLGMAWDSSELLERPDRRRIVRVL